MFIVDKDKCSFFTALDNTTLCEILHPDKQGLKINYSLAFAVLKPRDKSKSHRLKRSSEVYYILKGSGNMYIDDEIEKVSKNSVVYIPPGSKQYIENIGSDDLEFLCIVDPPWKPNDEEQQIG